MSLERLTRRPVLASAVALAAGLSVAGTGVATAQTPHIVVPQCSRSALQAGLSRGFDTYPGGVIPGVKGAFGCRGAWAYAFPTVGTRPHRVTVTSVFHDRGGRWVTVRREPACRSHSVPGPIYRPACESN